MSDIRRLNILLPADRAAWRKKREARRILLEKVRARRRLMAGRRSLRNNTEE